eukprot:CAMPEP_0119476152 /NCGR_PEP_ID=MMETSP1344-20130328/6778_1 /TAXON_ID=236787 /ORGANISM="Florenciella parvula, Strain CCMP2471" /LENGTH=129 /DNA_ID=CAMNT_0007509851 /DNA_START=672 /DNA_END=1062 /DNA_ORIENTATION=-
MGAHRVLKAFEVDNQNIRCRPKIELLVGMYVVLAFGAEPWVVFAELLSLAEQPETVQQLHVLTLTATAIDPVRARRRLGVATRPKASSVRASMPSSVHTIASELLLDIRNSDSSSLSMIDPSVPVSCSE